MNKILLYQISLIITLYLGYIFYVFTRKSIIFNIPHFGSNSSNSLNITKNDIGIIISTQNLAYALSKLFFGILSDVASNRILFGSGLFISGLLNIGIKKEIDIYGLYFQSFLIGLAQGPAWPTAAKLLQKWLPKSQFATWWSIISTASNAAGALGPIIATWISVRYHWSYGFMIPGCICMSMGYLAIIVLRNKPSDVGLTNFDEKQEDITVEQNDENQLGRFEKTKMILKYPFFISICLGYFLIQLIKTIFSDWSQIYLNKAVGIDSFKATYFVSLIEVFGLVGSVSSGVLSDFIFRLKSDKNSDIKPTKYRMIMVLVYISGIIVSMHLFNFYVKKNCDNFVLLYGIAATIGFLLYGSISLLGVMAMEFTSPELSGTSHALASLAANIGSIFAGVPFSMLSKLYNWNMAFKYVEAFSFVGFIFIFIFRNSSSYFIPTQKTNKEKTQ